MTTITNPDPRRHDDYDHAVDGHSAESHLPDAGFVNDQGLWERF